MLKIKFGKDRTYSYKGHRDRGVYLWAEKAIERKRTWTKVTAKKGRGGDFSRRRKTKSKGKDRTMRILLGNRNRTFDQQIWKQANKLDEREERSMKSYLKDERNKKTRGQRSEKLPQRT